MAVKNVTVLCFKEEQGTSLFFLHTWHFWRSLAMGEEERTGELIVLEGSGGHLAARNVKQRASAGLLR